MDVNPGYRQDSRYGNNIINLDFDNDRNASAYIITMKSHINIAELETMFLGPMM
jgi:hypothetical protein